MTFPVSPVSTVKPEHEHHSSDRHCPRVALHRGAGVGGGGGAGGGEGAGVRWGGGHAGGGRGVVVPPTSLMVPRPG